MKVSEVIKALQEKHSPDDDVMVIIAENKKGFPITVLEGTDKFMKALKSVVKAFGA